jgi:rare lipoprotein A
MPAGAADMGFTQSSRPNPHSCLLTQSSILTPQSRIIAALVAINLAGCGTFSGRDSTPVVRNPEGTVETGKPAVRSGSGGYYLNDGPGDNPPANLEQIPDAVPRLEPLRAATMRPYTVMGQNYTPMTRLAPYKQRGIASWYGRRYHDQKTSSGEIYDMSGMSAAHTVLPIPSFARVTNLANNKSVVVRINDRGPFHSDRLIDLSYTAAYKLGVLSGGRAMVEVELILPEAGTPQNANMATTPAIAEKSPASVAPADSAVAIPLPKNEPLNATPVLAVTAEPEAKGMFLQLGAFGSQDNAENYLARLRMQVDWLSSSLHVYAKDGLFRVHAGPYANQADARAAADRLNQALGIKAVVTAR